jgi:hypothetical protein
VFCAQLTRTVSRSVYARVVVRQQQWKEMLRRSGDNVSSNGARMVSDKLRQILIA